MSKRKFLTNIRKERLATLPKEINVFVNKNAYCVNGTKLDSNVSLHTQPTAKARILLLACLSPKTWLRNLIAGSKKKNNR